MLVGDPRGIHGKGTSKGMVTFLSFLISVLLENSKQLQNCQHYFLLIYGINFFLVIDGDICMQKLPQSHVIFSVKILKITVANKNVYIGFQIDIIDNI